MTAVGWFRDQLEFDESVSIDNIEDLLEQAKEMEKQQIIDAWNDVGADGVTTAEEYYINKFKSE